MPATVADNRHSRAPALAVRGPAVGTPVPAVERALAVMDLLARERRPLHMAGIAATLDLPKSSVHGLCSTLLSHGYLKRAGNGALQIGPGVMNLAQAFVADTHVASEFDALWRDAGSPPDETLILSVLNGAEVVYVGVRHGARPLGLAFNIGMRLPAWLAATGKAMLAQLSDAEVRALLPRPPLPPIARGAGRALPLHQLLADLAATRERGYSIDDGDVRAGVYALGVAVLGAGGQPVAGLGVCVNQAALTPAKHEQLRRLVVQAAQRLSQRLGARPEAAR